MKNKYIQLHFRYENPICQIGSVLDGQRFDELIDWGIEGENRIKTSVIPRIGEVIEVHNGYCFAFEVLDIRHRFLDDYHDVYLLLCQQRLGDPRISW
jgi:hypothetical protein